MSRFVRSSKFRHVFGKEFKKDKCFDNIRITRNAWDSNNCDVNEKFMAVIVEAGGGGAFLVLRHDQDGKQATDAPRLTGHKGAVLDVAFNPFNPNMIASGSDDCSVKVWVIPEEGLKENMNDAALTLNGHGRKVGLVKWHPTCENILFSMSTDLTLRAWDITTGEQVRDYPGHTDTIYSMSFNADGSKFVTTCKDKKVRIFDTLTSECLFTASGHEGTKSSRAVWLTNLDQILTTGHSRMSERQYSLWDNKLEKILHENIDTSSGVLMPFYDADLSILYIAGKGDGNIRYYEVNQNKPFIHPLSEYKSNTPQRGFGFLPKRACNVGACEIARFYKLHPQNLVEPISMIVPRKSDSFQDDIFPDTTGDKPSGTASDFVNGSYKQIPRISLKDGFVPSQNTSFIAPKVEEKKKEVIDNPQSVKDYQEAYHKLKSVVKKLEDELASKDVLIRQLQAKI